MQNVANRSAAQRVEGAVSRYGSPSELRITDMRLAVVTGAMYYPLLRIDTNQGVYGLGEVRDNGHIENALQFKSMLVGQNPLNVDYLFKAIRRFGNWGREGGGVSGIEIALWDLVGKVYGVPCYQFLGGKHRDRVRIYGDTPEPDESTPEAFAKAVRSRKELGLTFIKFDVQGRMFERTPGGTVGQPTKHEYPLHKHWRAPGAGRGTKLSQKGIEKAVSIVRAVREAVGNEISLCIDHFGEGYMTADEAIRLGRALEPYDLAWIEDPLPWHDIAGHKLVADALQVPVAGGEDWYLWDGFREAIETHAVDILHPDLLTSGGILETKNIADYGERFGLATALHCACSPIGFMANIHCAAAISSLVAVEHHGLDVPFWTDLVTGLDPKYMTEGYVKVPDAPGLGVDLNLEVIEANLRTPGTLFQPTDYWNKQSVGSESVKHHK
ncbi:MAG TPA: mandelate racemase/muconate lactonizing enzyme family protein [Acetobacteraceae bacterium]|jgi:L-alanine-DL-glutamate epimerase-like enolase superfamily enzyme|nr:mandelate racemase/muconate lactonizing enzyme family protein [Acetobacteraceae bacterium]